MSELIFAEITAALDGLKMESFTYGDTPSIPQYDALSETVNKTEFKYYDIQSNLLAGAPTDAGKYTVEVICETAKTVYSASADYEIYKKDISDADVELDGELVYNTAVQTQKIKSVSVGNLAVTAYGVSDNTAKDAGNYTLKITGKEGNFTGTKTVGFKVLKKTVMADVTVGGEYTYIAEEIKPSEVTVKDVQIVIPDSEYTFSYSDNKNAGNATVTVNNKDGGNYIVSGSAIFVIKKAKLTVTVNDVTREYGAANPEFSVTYSGFVNGENENGEGILSGSLVLEYDDRTMLPARFVAENLGAKVEWEARKLLVTITGKNLKTGDDVTILITIGAEYAVVNGERIKLDAPAFIEFDRTYTPVHFVSEHLGADVEWFENEYKVVITKPEKK